MNVLSLFDGISCGRVALERANIPLNKYYASEIKKHAIKVAMDNYHDTIQIGDVTKLHYENGKLYNNCSKTESSGNITWNLGDVVHEGQIHLLIGGSPCQDFSAASFLTPYKSHTDEAYGLKGLKSRLFYEYLRLKSEIQPTYFLLENVSMKKSSKDMLDDYLGVKGIAINSNLVSYQDRNRMYWTNIPNVTVPEDRNISFQDFIETDELQLEEAKTNRTPSRMRMWSGGKGKNGIGTCDNITHSKKIHCLTRKQDRCPNSGLIEYKEFCRFLTRSEIEQAQTLPKGYTRSISYNQCQDVCGDGWTVDVIAHIMSGLTE